MIKWSLLFKEKMKAAIILVVLMLGVIVSNLLEKKITNRNDLTVSSLLEDRLQPSIYLYEMRTLTEQRLFILEEYLHANDTDDKQRLKDKMQVNQQKFEELLSKYKSTLLVNEEQNVLSQLHQNIDQFDKAFSEIDVVQQNAVNVAKSSIVLINHNLGILNKLQSKIGMELLATYKQDTYYSSFLNAFQILLAMVFGIIILKMVANSSLLNKFDHKVNLN